MPRFAANLGFSPLEPLKPQTKSFNFQAGPTIPTSTPNLSGPSFGSDVPAAQFDWNSAGLVNPLDGKSNSCPGVFFSYYIFALIQKKHLFAKINF